MKIDYDTLFARIAQSDRAAFERLYRLTADALVRYVKYSTHSRLDAIDVVHDVFVTLWVRRLTIRVRTSARSYLYSAARNRALNILKREARRVPSDYATWQPGFMISPREPDAASRELEDNLARWIAELPGRRAEAFLLSRYHDLTHAEIARIMSLSERTVNTHITHALRDLRKKLDETGQFGLHSTDEPA